MSAPPSCGGAAADLTPLLEKDRVLATLLPRAREHRIQVLVSQVVRRKDGPCLRRLGYRVDAEYFYPASAIKLLGAIAALRWLEEREGLTLETPLHVEPASVPQRQNERVVIARPTAPESLRDTLEATLVVSSNSAFNRLYDLVGPDRLHREFWGAGFSSVRFRHRLEARGFPRLAQRFAPPIRTHERALEPLREARLQLPQNLGARPEVGQAHLEPGGKRVETPMSFLDRNGISLPDLHDALIAVVQPELAPHPVPLSDASRNALRAILARLVDEPPAAGAPADRVRYKPLLAGFRRGVKRPAAIHFENKAGRAYGFLVDNAYVRDRSSGRELFVTAVIYVNANGVVGDDQYEYATTGLGFFEALGERLAREFLRE